MNKYEKFIKSDKYGTDGYFVWVGNFLTCETCGKKEETVTDRGCDDMDLFECDRCYSKREHYGRLMS